MTEFNKEIIKAQLRERNEKANAEFRIKMRRLFRDESMFKNNDNKIHK